MSAQHADARSDAVIDREVRAILDRYVVQAAVREPVTTYAVWARGAGADLLPGMSERITEPATHAEAQEARKGLIVSDIIDLIRGEHD